MFLRRSLKSHGASVMEDCLKLSPSKVCDGYKDMQPLLKFTWKSLKTGLSVVFSRERQLQVAEMSSKLVQRIFKRINFLDGERGGH